MINQNSSSIWANWGGINNDYERGQFPNKNSLNSYALGSVAKWMYKNMAGLSTDEEEVGFKKFIIKPYIDSKITKFCLVTYISVYGKIESEWLVNDDFITIAVSIYYT